MSLALPNLLAELENTPQAKTGSVDVERVRLMTHDIWTTVLGLKLEPVIGILPKLENAGFHYSASVRIIGCENLTVSLHFPKTLAQKIAASLFSTADENEDQDQITDTLKELVNILGGNIKGTLNQYHFLSTPAVSLMEDGFLRPEGSLICEYFYKCQGEYLNLTVVERY
jgi:CheY-specific phosphatase CheX